MSLTKQMIILQLKFKSHKKIIKNLALNQIKNKMILNKIIKLDIKNFFIYNLAKYKL